MPAFTRGPLPARVYWVRRMLVLGTAVLLVVGIARLLGGGSDASSGEDTAARTAARTSTSSAPVTTTTTTTSPSAGLVVEPPREPRGRQTQVPLAEPEGPCAGGDVAVTPKVRRAVAGRDVRIRLQLHTLSSPACTWRIGHDTLVVNISSGHDHIWTTRDCPKALQGREVVVRRDVATQVDLVWNAKRSDEDCTRFTEWAMPGWYHVAAAALAGEPADTQFELTTPVAGTITRTVSPTESPSASTSASSSTSPSRSASESPSQGPTGRPVVTKSASGAGGRG